LDEMYDKVLFGLRYFTKDLRSIEERVFDTWSLNKDVLEEIMIKRRNIVSLKHMLKPQEEILDALQHDDDIKNFRWDELEVYFEDLEYKLEKIMGQVTIVSEDIDSLYDTYNALINMKLNSIITLLTIFTAIMWVLTLITWFYGMNIVLPWVENPLTVWRLIWGMIMLSVCLFILFKQKKWF
jgi:magnesium transporter